MLEKYATARTAHSRLGPSRFDAANAGEPFEQHFLDAVVGGAGLTQVTQCGLLLPAMHDGTDRIGQVIAPVDAEDRMKEIMRFVRGCIWIGGQSLSSLWDKHYEV